MPKGSESASTTKRKITGEKPTHVNSPTWASFSDRLIGALQSLEAGQWLIIQKQGTPDWVQFAAEGNGKYRAEAKSNFYRELDQELSLEQQVSLSRIGWKQPTGTGSESTAANDPHGIGEE